MQMIMHTSCSSIDYLVSGQTHLNGGRTLFDMQIKKCASLKIDILKYMLANLIEHFLFRLMYPDSMRIRR